MTSPQNHTAQLPSTRSGRDEALARFNVLWDRLVHTRSFRLALVLATGIMLSYSYKTVNQYCAPKFDFALPIDDHILFYPWTGLVYWSYYGLFIGGAWVVNPKLFTRMWVGVLVANLVSYALYVPFTAYVHHPDVTFVEPEWLGDMYRDFYNLDGPGNTMPSLHCALSAILGWNIRKHHWGWMVWAMAICVSTLTTKEHVILDVFAGWLLAYAVQRWIVRPDAEPANEERQREMVGAEA